MKVLIDGNWQEFEVEFGEAMPEEIGGVQIFPTRMLEDQIWDDLDREIFSFSVYADPASQLLLVQYLNYEEPDFSAYEVKLSDGEFITYINHLG